VGSPTAPPQAASISQLERRRAATAAAAGTAIEYFDWMVYATFAVYFAPLLFDAADSTSALLQSAAVFAVGYFLRPLGAFLFGKIGDRFGRKPSLTISVGLITIGTLLLAVTPTYAQVGLLASIILLIARSLQGLAYGGEFGTIAATLREIAPPDKRGRYSSLFIVSGVGGQVAGFLALLILQSVLTREQMNAFGWRIPFGLALVGALIVMYLRRKMVESPVFLEGARATPERRGSLSDLLTTHRVPVALAFLVIALTAPVLLTFTTYIQKFGINSLGLDPRSVSYAVLVVLILLSASSWFWGVLGDRIGSATVFTIGCAGSAVLVLPAYFMMTSVPSALVVALASGAVVLFVAMYGAVQQTVLAGLFPPRLRALGAGFPFALGLAVSGGTTELVALSFKAVGFEVGHFVLITVMGIAGIVVAAIIRRRLSRGVTDPSS
jgi:MHS family alpha-ketoglutarate permease-like MFS transporter